MMNNEMPELMGNASLTHPTLAAVHANDRIIILTLPWCPASQRIFGASGADIDDTCKTS